MTPVQESVVDYARALLGRLRLTGRACPESTYGHPAHGTAPTAIGRIGAVALPAKAVLASLSPSGDPKVVGATAPVTVIWVTRCSAFAAGRLRRSRSARGSRRDRRLAGGALVSAASFWCRASGCPRSSSWRWRPRLRPLDGFEGIAVRSLAFAAATSSCVGADEGGAELIEELAAEQDTSLRVFGIVDDDRETDRSPGVPILGGIARPAEVVAADRPDLVVLAGAADRLEAFDRCSTRREPASGSSGSPSSTSMRSAGYPSGTSPRRLVHERPPPLPAAVLAVREARVRRRVAVGRPRSSPRRSSRCWRCWSARARARSSSGRRGSARAAGPSRSSSSARWATTPRSPGSRLGGGARSAHHARRPVHAPDAPRRAAPALERPEGRDVDRRPPPGAARVRRPARGRGALLDAPPPRQARASPAGPRCAAATRPTPRGPSRSSRTTSST